MEDFFNGNVKYNCNNRMLVPYDNVSTISLSAGSLKDSFPFICHILIKEIKISIKIDAKIMLKVLRK